MQNSQNEEAERARLRSQISGLQAELAAVQGQMKFLLQNEQARQQNLRLVEVEQALRNLSGPLQAVQARMARFEKVATLAHRLVETEGLRLLGTFPPAYKQALIEALDECAAAGDRPWEKGTRYPAPTGRTAPDPDEDFPPLL